MFFRSLLTHIFKYMKHVQMCDASKELKYRNGTAAKKAFINRGSIPFSYTNFIMTSSSVNATTFNALTHQSKVCLQQI